MKANIRFEHISRSGRLKGAWTQPMQSFTQNLMEALYVAFSRNDRSFTLAKPAYIGSSMGTANNALEFTNPGLLRCTTGGFQGATRQNQITSTLTPETYTPLFGQQGLRFGSGSTPVTSYDNVLAAPFDPISWGSYMGQVDAATRADLAQFNYDIDPVSDMLVGLDLVPSPEELNFYDPDTMTLDHSVALSVNLNISSLDYMDILTPGDGYAYIMETDDGSPYYTYVWKVNLTTGIVEVTSPNFRFIDGLTTYGRSLFDAGSPDYIWMGTQNLGKVVKLAKVDLTQVGAAVSYGRISNWNNSTTSVIGSYGPKKVVPAIHATSSLVWSNGAMCLYDTTLDTLVPIDIGKMAYGVNRLAYRPSNETLIGISEQSANPVPYAWYRFNARTPGMMHRSTLVSDFEYDAVDGSFRLMSELYNDTGANNTVRECGLFVEGSNGVTLMISRDILSAAVPLLNGETLRGTIEISATI